MGNMAADERAERRARYLEAAAQHARQIANSTKALRDELTPEQRNRFDRMSLRHGQGNTFRQNDRRAAP